ncbi:ABC transporter permease [candidate division KSB1 bacterium]
MNNDDKKPPFLHEWILRVLFPDEGEYTTIADVEEVFHEIWDEKGPKAAKRWYRLQTFRSSSLYFKNSIGKGYFMYKNYLKIAFRNLKRNKIYSLINISGLSLGMTCCLLILLYVKDELSFDDYHQKADRIYRILATSEFAGAARTFAATPSALGPAFAGEIPEVESQVRMFRMNFNGNTPVSYEDKTFEESGMYFTDSTFFSIFTFEFIAGDPEGVLNEPNSLVITESVAKKFFGDDDPLGKILVFFGRQNAQVMGVIKDVPRNSHFDFDYILSINSISNRVQAFNDWIFFYPYTYLLLKDDAEPDVVEAKITDVFGRHSGQELEKRGIKREYPLQKLKDIYLTSHYEGEFRTNGNIVYVYLFSAIAFFILIIACVNFINLSTARSANRGKEVGLRKVVGANRRQLINQFIGESVLMSLIAMIIGFLLMIFVLPLFNNLAGKEMDISHLSGLDVILSFLGFIIVSGIIAGSFPAFFLSAFKPVAVLKGALSSGARNIMMRKILVVFQFSISIMLIISTFVVYEQLEFIKNKYLGFDKEQLLIMIARDPTLARRAETVRNEILMNPDIVSVSFTGNLPGQYAGENSYLPEGKEQSDTHRATFFMVDYDFIETFKMEILYGRNFSRDFPADTLNGIIVNESLARNIGWQEDAVGKRMDQAPDRPDQPDLEKRIIGVVKDFHHRSLKFPVVPTILVLNTRFYNNIAVRIKDKQANDVVEYLKSKWEFISPGSEFNYYFVDEQFDGQYEAEEKLGQLYITFALIAILIACLGLFGLASFVSEQRTKEIGIRKVMGARVNSIVIGLSKDFTKWVLIANVFAWPLAYYVMDRWMTNFAYRMDIEIWIFGVSGIISILVAGITVIYQTIKAATINPVDSLKYE